MKKLIWVAASLAVAVGLLVALNGPSIAGPVLVSLGWQSQGINVRTGPLPALVPIDLGEIDPGVDDVNDPLVFPDTRFAVNGGPLRDGRKVVINVVGPPPDSVLVRGFLYWQWACLDTPVAGKHDSIRFKQAFPIKGGSGFQTGSLIAAGGDSWGCGGGTSNHTYRLDVTEWMSPTGGGTYAVTLPAGAAGSERHQDPWGCDPATAPLCDGAVILAIYASSCEPNGTVYLYDSGLASNLFSGDVGITYALTHAPAPGGEARLALVGGGGQVGSGYTAASGIGVVETFVNSSLVAGPGSVYNDSAWNGSTAKPLPQLWDVSGHDVSDDVAFGATSTSVLSMSSVAGGDSLVPVINILMLR